MTDKPGSNQMKVNIDLDPEIALGSYVNMAMVNHTETEVTIDFIYVQPQEPKGSVRARIITSPKHAKRLLAALSENIRQFEQKFGPIDGPTLAGGARAQRRQLTGIGQDSLRSPPTPIRKITETRRTDTVRPQPPRG